MPQLVKNGSHIPLEQRMLGKGVVVEDEQVALPNMRLKDDNEYNCFAITDAC